MKYPYINSNPNLYPNSYPIYNYPSATYNPLTGQSIPINPIPPTTQPTIINPVYNPISTYPSYNYNSYLY